MTPDADHEHIESLTESIQLPQATLDSIQILRVEVHATLHNEFHQVAIDLEQLGGLLSDAALRLSGAFGVITNGSRELESAMQSLPAAPTPSELRRLTEITAEMISTTGPTVQSLQFEDMATQLLTHVSNRLTILESFSKDMVALNPTGDDAPAAFTAAAFEDLFTKLEKHRTILAAAHRKSVQQQSLEAGEIELF